MNIAKISRNSLAAGVAAFIISTTGTCATDNQSTGSTACISRAGSTSQSFIEFLAAVNAQGLSRLAYWVCRVVFVVF